MPARGRHVRPSPPCAALDPGQGTGRLSMEVEGACLRVRTPGFSTPWLPDAPSHRHLTLVWMRLLVDARGIPLVTLQELASIVGSANRQAASQHRADFRQCGEDFHALVLRQRKVDATVVEGVLTALQQTPLAGPTELAERVNAQWGRQDLTAANIQSALEQISCVPVLRALWRQLAGGQVHYREAYLLAEMLESQAHQAPHPTCWGIPSIDRGMKLADPTALAVLMTPDLPIAHVPESLCWLTVSMTLFYWHVP
jgi:hypothetical protein